MRAGETWTWVGLEGEAKQDIDVIAVIVGAGEHI